LLEVKWDNIIIVVDGPRNINESIVINDIIYSLKKILSNNSMNAEFIIRETNYGCRRNIELALEYFFNKFLSGWVFEDDIVLEKHDLFNYYRENFSDLGHLSLYNPVKINSDSKKYYKIENGHYFIWGWYLKTSTTLSFKQPIRYTDFLKIIKHRGIRHGLKFSYLVFNTIFFKIDTWDSLYTLWGIRNNVNTFIIPDSIIKNIGFDENATHTKVDTRENLEIRKWNYKNWKKELNKTL
jgi:hypothetical protein